MLDRFAIDLTEPGLANYIRRYQAMLAARQQDPETLRQHYLGDDEIILSIDGPPSPRRGTRPSTWSEGELTGKRAWFAEALLSATADEVQRLIAQARRWAEGLGKTVTLWISDKQDAFVTGIAGEFPGVPHRYCSNHFLRDLAKPVLEADSHAKVQMRQKVRGLRGVEQAVLKHRRESAAGPVPAPPSEATGTEAAVEPDPPAAPEDPVGDVVLDYCVAVRGNLNDDQGGPLHPPGLQDGQKRWMRSGAVDRAKPGREKRGFKPRRITESIGRPDRQGPGRGEAPAGSDAGPFRDVREGGRVPEPRGGPGSPQRQSDFGRDPQKASGETRTRSTSRWPA